MKCEFEEKQYEHPLNRELAWKGRIYNPGQVYEHKIAIDAAILSKNPEFWTLWNNNAKVTWKTGLILRPELWDLVKETLNSDVFPRFKFNLLVQARAHFFLISGILSLLFSRARYLMLDLVQKKQ